MTPAVRGEARRGLILDAAIRIVGREGAGSLTHRRVAAEAELPVAATTYWFASKEELLTEAYRLAAQRDIERIGVVADRAGEDLTDTLMDVLGAELAIGREALVACFSMWFEAVRHPKLREIEREWAAAYEDVVRRILERGGAPHPERDAPLVVSAIDGMLLAMLTRNGDAEELRPQLERLGDALLSGD